MLPIVAVLSLVACEKKSADAKTKSPDQPMASLRVPPPIYGPDAQAPEKVMDRCKFDLKLAEAIVETKPGAQVSTSGVDGKYLNMEIVSMRGVDPASQGERIVVVRGTYEDNGLEIGTFRARYTAQGALMGGMAGVCQGLGEIAELMAVGISQWLLDPKSGAELHN